MTMTRPSWVVRVVCLSERGMVGNSGSAYTRDTREWGVVSDNEKA